MSDTTRNLVVSKLIFQKGIQRSDLLNASFTDSSLIAMLYYLVQLKGYHIEITAVRSDHHDDGQGPGLHAAGLAVDCWPLLDAHQGDYLDATTQAFRSFLTDVSKAPYYYDTGLGGSAFLPANMIGNAFQDSAQDHVHCGVLPA